MATAMGERRPFAFLICHLARYPEVAIWRPFDREREENLQSLFQ